MRDPSPPARPAPSASAATDTETASAHGPGDVLGLGRTLPWRLRLSSWCLRTFYFGRVALRGERSQPSPPRGGRLVLASHRNGAIDGYQVLAAFPGIQFLASVQLLRNPFLRLMFAGIPVVRDKDRKRYGISRDAFADPVQAAVAHLRAGGDLAIFPEGSSEWGHHPLRYQRGAARIACELIEQDADIEIVPAGLFYSAPDRFRSRAEAWIGAPMTLPPRAGRERRDWEAEVHRHLSQSLDAVSVNCADAATFERVQSQAVAAARRGGDFAGTFLSLQDRPARAQTGDAVAATSPWPRRLGLAMMFALAPVLLGGTWLGRKADARNTVTFFRMAGGLAVALAWVPVLAIALWRWPGPVTVALAIALLGWWVLGIERWRP